MNNIKSDFEKAKMRKIEHLFFCDRCKRVGVFKNVKLYPQELSELSMSDISTNVKFLDLNLDYPSYINAITGGSHISTIVNKKLAILSKNFNIPVVTGSMSMYLKYGEIDSYLPLKKAYKVIVNLSARESVEDFKRIADKMDTNYVSIHINTAQELLQKDGDLSFKGEIKNIYEVRKEFGDNLIVKAVGQGMSYDTIRKLEDIGVKNIDISGHGGTDFSEIEANRLSFKNHDFPYLSTEESLENLNKFDVYKIVSGGIDKPIDMIKSLIKGGDITASAYYYLSLTKLDMNEAINKIKDDRNEFKKLMLLLGVKNIDELKGVTCL